MPRRKLTEEEKRQKRFLKLLGDLSEFDNLLENFIIFNELKKVNDDVSQSKDRLQFCKEIDNMIKNMPELHSAVIKIADTVNYGASLSQLEQYKVIIVKKDFYYAKKRMFDNNLNDLNESYYLLEEENNNDKAIIDALSFIEEWEEETEIKDLVYDVSIDLVKYGDAFMEMGKKSTNIYYLPSNEITWDLDKKTGKPIKYYQTKNEIDKKSISAENIIHFSTSVVPPGETMLFPLLRSWRYLKILEDAIIINRITRAIMKLIFKIDVSGKDSAKAKMYLLKFAQKLKEKTQINIREGMIQGDYSGLNDFLNIILPVTRDSATDVKSIDGDSSLQRVDDVNLMHKRLLSSLEIPKAYLNFEEATRNRSIIDRIETNFARSVRKYQRKLIKGLKIVYKNVLLRERIIKDWSQYNLIIEFPNPSLIDEQIKTEIQQRKTLILINLYNVLSKTLPNEFIINYIFSDISNVEKAKLVEYLKNNDDVSIDKNKKNDKNGNDKEKKLKPRKTVPRQNISRDREDLRTKVGY